VWIGTRSEMHSTETSRGSSESDDVDILLSRVAAKEGATGRPLAGVSKCAHETQAAALALKASDTHHTGDLFSRF
jgi:hypothetical protein